MVLPDSGEPANRTGLVHAIERHNLDGLPGEKAVYARRSSSTPG